MIGAGLLAKKAVERGLTTKPWVKTSLAPGSRVVTDYLEGSGLLPYLERCGSTWSGYGCTTCIGNSGPLPEVVGQLIDEHSAGRRRGAERQPELRGPGPSAGPGQLSRLADAGRGLRAGGPGGHRPQPGAARHRARTASRSSCATSGRRRRGDPRRDGGVAQAGAVRATATRRCSRATRPGRRSRCPEGSRYAWDPNSTYVQEPPFFVDLPAEPPPLRDISGARVLAVLGDSVTTDHISPGRLDPEERPRRPVPARSTASSRWTGTPSAPAAATTR